MLTADISFSDSFQRTFDNLGDFLPKLVGAIAIFLIGWFIALVESLCDVLNLNQ